MNIPPIQLLMMGAGLIATLVLLMFAFAGPSAGKAQSRRLEGLRNRHSDSGALVIEAQMRKIGAARDSKVDSFFGRIVPKPAVLKKRLDMTGKKWTVAKYAMFSIGGVFASTRRRGWITATRRWPSSRRWPRP